MANKSAGQRFRERRENEAREAVERQERSVRQAAYEASPEAQHFRKFAELIFSARRGYSGPQFLPLAATGQPAPVLPASTRQPMAPADAFDLFNAVARSGVGLPFISAINPTRAVRMGGQGG